MTSPIDPARRAERIRKAKRSQAQAGSGARSSERNLPVPVQPPQPPAAPPPVEGPDGAAVVAAHLLGQSGQKRGLKGGPAVLEAARTAYVRTEWSGPADRRRPKGDITKKEV